METSLLPTVENAASKTNPSKVLLARSAAAGADFTAQSHMRNSPQAPPPPPTPSTSLLISPEQTLRAGSFQGELHPQSSQVSADLLEMQMETIMQKSRA